MLHIRDLVNCSGRAPQRRRTPSPKSTKTPSKSQNILKGGGDREAADDVAVEESCVAESASEEEDREVAVVGSDDDDDWKKVSVRALLDLLDAE